MMKKIKSERKSAKGLAFSLMHLVFILVMIGGVAVMYYMFRGKYFDIQATVESNEIERHAVNIGQIILSSKDLVYSETIGGEERYYRGVFDKSKIDSAFVTEDEYETENIAYKENSIYDQISFPNAVAEIILEESERENLWLFTVTDYSLEGSSDFMNCVARSVGLGIVNKYQSCSETYLQSKSGTFEKTFPVLIRDSGELYPASLKVTVHEKASRLGETPQLQNV